MIPEEIREETRNLVSQMLTRESIKRIVRDEFTVIVDEIVRRDVNWLEGEILEKVVCSLNSEVIVDKAKEKLKERLDEEIENHIRRLDYWEIHREADKTAMKLVGLIVRERANALDLNKIVHEALEPAIREAIDTPIAEIIKQHLGLIYGEFKAIKQSWEEMHSSWSRMEDEIAHLKLRE